MRNVLLLSSLLLIGAINAVAETAMSGELKGIVLDKTTRSPVIAANVIVLGEGKGAATDLEGRFVIGNLSPDTYHIQASALGYEVLIISEIAVTPGRSSSVEFRLTPSMLVAEEVVFTKKTWFAETNELPTSNRGLRYEEIRRAPGASEDVQRMIQAFPGVAGENDQNNEIVVRGGSPSENLIVLDGIEIDNINHYGYEGGSGGPISQLDPEFLQDVNFASGGFAAKYGDRLSSVLAMDLREGDREEYHGELGIGMAGAGGNIEGPLPGGNGSFLASYRKSYLEFIVESGAAGLTSVPKYWDFQTKIVRDFGPKQTLSIFVNHGYDVIVIDAEDGEGGYSRGAEAVDYDGAKTIVGGRLRSLWGWGFTDLVAARSISDWNVIAAEVRENDNNALYTEDVYWQKNSETADQLHFHANGKAFNKDEWSAGVTFKPISFTHNWWLIADTTLFDDGSLGPTDGAPDVNIRPVTRVHEETTSFKYASYLQYSWRPKSELTIVGGLRYDGFDYSGEGGLGPRASITYNLSPKWIISGAAGIYYQSHPLLNYTSDSGGANKNLPHARAIQYVIGLSHLPREATKISIEAYYKKYNSLLVSEQWLERESGNSSFLSDRLLTSGEKESWGLELFMQQKLMTHWYGIFSLSVGQSRFSDPVHDDFPSDYDFPIVASTVLGYKTSMTDWRKSEQTKWYWWWTVPLPINGDELSVSSRLRYLGGRPFTDETWYGEGVSSPMPIYDEHWEPAQVNGTRFPDYSRWDIRIDNKYFYGNSALVVYVEVQNILNKMNVADYVYADDNEIDTIEQFRFFFVGGVKYEF